MQSLTNSQMRSTFRMPELTPEQWDEQAKRAREWEQAQETEKVRARIEAAGIPERYRSKVQPYPGVMEWAENPTVGLLLQGEVGRGKTHQACMTLMRQAERGTARFTTFDDLLRECRATYQNWDTEEAVVGRYANTGMLCIDDMGKERPTEWSMPIIFAIINKRSMAGKPTIITTQHTGRQLIERMTVNGDSETARAIISRLMEYTRIEVEGPDWRRKTKIDGGISGQ